MLEHICGVTARVLKLQSAIHIGRVEQRLTASGTPHTLSMQNARLSGLRQRYRAVVQLLWSQQRDKCLSA